DFTDKQDGYDFYPLQSIQPYALADTLLRLGLSSKESLEITAFDISPRVLQHLAASQEAALQARSYVVQLPRDLHRGWRLGAIHYWQRFGDQIGVPVKPVAVPANVSGLVLRAVRIRSVIASRVTPVDLNIVLQRAEDAEKEGGRDGEYDLIIATNIFV